MLEFVEAAGTYRHPRHTYRKHRRQKRYGTRRGRIPGSVRIVLRPGIVALRARFGDWEADTFEGARDNGAIVSHVERKSRYLLTLL